MKKKHKKKQITFFTRQQPVRTKPIRLKSTQLTRKVRRWVVLQHKLHTFSWEKNSVFFVKNRAPDVAVTILNASKVVISEKHLQNNTYARFSGYQGGLKFDTLEALIARHGYKEAVKRAIKGMIPSTKLRPGMLKRLVITD